VTVQQLGAVYNILVLVLTATVAYILATKLDKAVRVPMMPLALVTRLVVIVRVVELLLLATVLANAARIITLLPLDTMQVEIINVMYLLLLDVVPALAVRTLEPLLLVT
jgi:hypothetical protein